MPEPLLRLRGVSIAFGGLSALRDVDVDVASGQIVGLIGPNGAGKTTLFNVVTRLNTPDRGEATFDGRDLLRCARHEVIAQGIARTFQNLLLFNQMTALDNVLVGLHARTRAGLLACSLHLGGMRREEEGAVTRARAALDLVGLRDAAGQRARNLSFGHQRLLELARALVSQPRLLLLDEPGAGLTALELGGLTEVIGRIRGETGVTILLIGHTMRLVLGLSERVVVLDHGVKIAEGTSAEVRTDPEVMRAYLGQPETHAQA